MSNFDRIDVRGKLVAVVGALLFSTICIGSAVGPAHAVASPVYAQAQASTVVAAHV